MMSKQEELTESELDGVSGGARARIKEKPRAKDSTRLRRKPKTSDARAKTPDTLRAKPKASHVKPKTQPRAKPKGSMHRLKR